MVRGFQGRYAIVLAFTALFCSMFVSSLTEENALYDFSSVDSLWQVPRFGGSPLAKRDVCTDAIPGTVSQICTPGNTLCCVPSQANIAFPQCQLLFNQGFCCVKEGGACYTDMKSNCPATGAIRCTVLAEGTTEACCPQFTECPNNFNQTTALVRCQFTPQASTSTTAISSSSTSTSSPTSTSTSTSTTASLSTPASSNAAQPTNSPTSAIIPSSQPGTTSTSLVDTEPKGLSAGANAGIGIAAALAILALAALGFWLYRRGRRKGELAARRASADRFPPSPYYDATGTTAQSLRADDQGFHQHVRYGKHELPSERQYSELATERHFELSELPAGSGHL